MRGLEIKVIKQDQIIIELEKEIEKLKFENNCLKKQIEELKFENNCLEKENRKMEGKLNRINFISENRKYNPNEIVGFDEFLEEIRVKSAIEIIKMKGNKNE